MINFVKIRWRDKWAARGHGLQDAIMGDAGLTWAAKGLGMHLIRQREGVRFPNSIYDGTMDALQNLADHGYINVIKIEDVDAEA
jgi:hypothetical protein